MKNQKNQWSQRS